jgi:hypothetical protein
MRSFLIRGFVVLIEALLIVAYVTIAFAARTALSVAPSE